MVNMDILMGIITAGIFVLGIAAIHFLPRFKWWAATALLVLITFVALPGFWFSSGPLGVSDWDLYFSYYHALRHTVVEFHQFPLWNPWICGGSAALGDPEFPVFSPIFASILALGVENGFRFNIYIVTAIGAVGVLLLGKRLQLSVYAALIAAIGVAFSSVNLLEVVEGHPNIFSAMWIPWIFWAWLGAYREAQHIKRPFATKWAAITGIFLALTFFQGGIYLLSYTAGAFLLLLLLASRHRHAFWVSLSAGVWALGFAAIKFVPTLLWLTQFQDESYASSTYTLFSLHKVFFGRYLHGAGEPGSIIPNQGSGWHEYGAYIGPFIAALAVVGLARFRQSRMVRSLFVATILAIFVSSAGPILKPLFDIAPFIPRSNISRIILFAVIPIALLAGYGLDTIRQHTSRKFLLAFFTIAITAFIAGDLFTLSMPLSHQAFVLPYPAVIPSPAPSPITHITHTYETRHNGTDYNRTYAAAQQGYGTSGSCNVLRPANAVRTIHDEENFGPVLSGSYTRVESVDWTPNHVTTRVIATPPQTDEEQPAVMLNTNYAAGWWVQPRDGDALVPAQNIQGRVGIWTRPGTYEFIFMYKPKGMYTGVGITIVTVIAAVVLVFARRRPVQE